MKCFSSKETIKELQLPNHSSVLAELRKYGLLGFHTRGRKYLYHASDFNKLRKKLFSGEIEFKTDGNKYYLTIN